MTNCSSTAINQIANSFPKVPRVVSVLCTSLFLFTLTSQTNCLAQSFTKKDLQQIYVESLTKEGFRPEKSPQGNILFKRDGRRYIIYIDEKDPLFFQVEMGLSANDKSPAMRRKRLEATNLVAQETKVVKAYIDGDGDPVFSGETYVLNPKDAIKNIERLLDGIDFAYSKYIKKLEEPLNNTPDSFRDESTKFSTWESSYFIKVSSISNF
jgi:hypothetical protein